MSSTVDLIVYSDGDARTPQAIRRLRRQNRDYSKYLGEPTVVMHRYDTDDIEQGIAKTCPACFRDDFGSARNDCQICFGVGFVSVEDDPTDYVDVGGRNRSDTDTGSGIKAPLYGGYSKPFLTFMIEPDKPTDEIKWGPDGALTRTKQGEGYAPWTPTLYDNDLCINVLIDRNFNILQEGERYVLAQVHPVTIRGFGRSQNFQEFLVAQQFEMAKVPNQDPHIIYQVPIRRGKKYIDADRVKGIAVVSAVLVKGVHDTGSVKGKVQLQSIFDSAITDAATVTASAFMLSVDDGLIDAGTVTGNASFSAVEVRFSDAATVTGQSLFISTVQGDDAATVAGAFVGTAIDGHGYIDSATEAAASVVAAADSLDYLDNDQATGISAITALDVGATPFVDGAIITAVAASGTYLMPGSGVLPGPGTDPTVLGGDVEASNDAATLSAPGVGTGVEVRSWVESGTLIVTGIVSDTAVALTIWGDSGSVAGVSAINPILEPGDGLLPGSGDIVGTDVTEEATALPATTLLPSLAQEASIHATTDLLLGSSVLLGSGTLPH